MPIRDRVPAGARPIGWRGWVLIAIVAAGAGAFVELRLDPRDIIPSAGGLALAWAFVSRAWQPALTYEAAFVPMGTPPLFLNILDAMRATVVFAAAACSLAVVSGLVLGVLTSASWWLDRPGTEVGRLRSAVRRFTKPVLYGGGRVLISFLRSIHELLWAVLFLAAFGLSNVTAVLAIAIPYAGTFAKVFSELIDETPGDAASALHALGASPLSVFALGVLPRALPDLGAYAFYRFECALRSSAVLGFFGFPTLGYSIAASFENLHFGEVWSYLYALILLVVVVDWWSGAMRRRLVA